MDGVKHLIRHVLNGWQNPRKRRATGLYACIHYLLLGICLVSILTVALPAQAEEWRLIVTSEDGYQKQYIDVDSVQFKEGHVRLKTYWLDTHQRDDVTHAVTEYDCDRQLYRDIELNGKPHQTDWFDLSGDRLNRAVMLYACPKSGAAR